MSTELFEIPSLRGTLTGTQYCAGEKHGAALRISQDTDAQPCSQADLPGFIQLSLTDVVTLLPILANWIKSQYHHKAGVLLERIQADQHLRKTIFEEAAKCEKFIDDLAVPKFAMTMLEKVKL